MMRTARLLHVSTDRLARNTSTPTEKASVNPIAAALTRRDVTQPRTRRPGRAPVSRSWSRVRTPWHSVAT